jgi:hypothetical protein
MKGLKIFTAQFGYNGPSRHDTTIRTNTSCFAPNWNIVMDHKNGKITDEGYTEKYIQILEQSLLGRKKEWLSVLKQKEVVLVCMCGRGKFCHRYLIAMFLEKFGAKYMGELNVSTGSLIPTHKYLPEFMTQETLQLIYDFQLPDYMQEPKTDFSGMVVDALAIQAMQSGTCRGCRENRTAQAWTQKGTVQFGIVPKQGQDEELNSKNFACCTHHIVNGKVEYACPIFKELVFGYKVGLTSRGANIDPCKNCTDHADNGGTCLGERCPDGTFPIKEGSGMVRN